MIKLDNIENLKYYPEEGSDSLTFAGYCKYSPTERVTDKLGSWMKDAINFVREKYRGVSK